MTEYHERVKEAAEARIGGDRMAMGLSIIPDPLRGDMAEIERLKAEIGRLETYNLALAYSCDFRDAEIERLRAAIQRIDGINDNPADYNSEINAACDTILRPELERHSQAKNW